MNILFVSLSIWLLGSSFLCVASDPVEDKQALLDFLGNATSHSRSLNWSENTSVCETWAGVTCNNHNSRIIEVHLPALGFYGPIPPNTVGRLSALQILSLRSNGLSGSFPLDFYKLENLTGLYLQFNKFSGPLPLDFSVWNNLSIINLSDNDFNGTIPSSISNLTHLTALNLANNLLSGRIPDISVPKLQHLNLSNNNLTGIVPRSLQRFPSWAFTGNNLSSVSTLSPAFPVQPPNTQTRKTSKLGEPAVLAIVLGSGLIGFVIVAIWMIICCSSKEGGDGGWMKAQKGVESSKIKVSESQNKENRIVFFEGSTLAFDLEDLLRASAEILGKGTFGVTYKAALEDATTVVVKRLKEASIGRREFEQQMAVIGNIRHDNVAALRAYYHSKDENLVVYDYFTHGSVSAMLHSNGRPLLDWETRLRIAIGAARGIAHIHKENGGKLIHGNLKASNIFLNFQGYGCVLDTSLATLMNPLRPPMMRTAGYRAPEVTDTRKASQASDVYSFGVLLFELLTGKSPVHSTGGEAIYLVRWVQSVVREEWTAEVFDAELLRYPNIEEEMVEMLQIGMTCVSKMPHQRPQMEDVLKMVENIRGGTMETNIPGN